MCIKGGLKRHFLYWKNHLRANKFVLDVIKFGYILPFKAVPPTHFARRNNLSSLRNKKFVLESIKDLLKNNFIKEVFEPPHCVNPLTVADNGEKLRLVLDLGFVNDFLDIPKFKYEDLKTVISLIKKGIFS